MRIETLPTTNVDLDQYTEAVIARLRKSISNFELINNKKFKKQDLLLKQISYEGIHRDLTYTWIQRILINENYAYFLLYSLPDGTIQDDEIMTIINSFSIIAD